MPYVDGFIVAVPKKNLTAYARMAKKAGKVWREYGALDYREWIADDAGCAVDPRSMDRVRRGARNPASKSPWAVLPASRVR